MADPTFKRRGDMLEWCATMVELAAAFNDWKLYHRAEDASAQRLRVLAAHAHLLQDKPDAR
jgi:hypothetical protein